MFVVDNPFTNFEGSHYHWRAVEIVDGISPNMWQGEIGYQQRGQEQINWQPYGTLKSSKEDAEYGARRMARHRSMKM